MKTGIKFTLITLGTLIALALLTYYMTTNEIAVLEPQGWIGEKERSIIVTCTLLMLIVVVPVFILTAYFGVKYREKNKKAKYSPEHEHNHIAECFWWGVPLIIIAIISVITWKSSHELNPFRPLKSETKPLKIQVVALNWKWLFIYPEQGIATVNAIQFPEQVPLNFEITADAPMNNFWIPKLGGMIMAMPGMRSKLHLIANSSGEFEGSSSQISGRGFSGMMFKARATSREEFDQWVAEVKSGGRVLNLDEYKRLAMPSEYVPPAYYGLEASNLFDWVMMQYHTPDSHSQLEVDKNG